MSHAALTAKYRPQTFADVAGQETLKAILSRASLERRVAPAYLFSGTRGVGKTTLARIFAKALNCRSAPAAEPCNQCDQCRAITAGNAVDVVEIDGASNRGIDDVRRLKEVVGYAPMEGAYKIFIIDEAHMLSREAFNALLKTLEEPPARVTFIMATTEPHKFPATIISRCQHYVFKRLPEKGLVEHLCSVLTREKVGFDDNAVRLIARRGAGSVRDSMSLLGQVLALREGKLSEEAARSVLGLAGQEAFLRMLDAFRDGDGLSLSRMLRDMLDQGLDMGFFLRELSSLWRNLFMLRQSGAAALGVVDLPEDEAKAYLEAASGFSLQHIHASWQMTLEGQRRVLTSLEPALALELLLLNLAMLPRLLSLENVSALVRRPGPGVSGQGAPGSGQGSNQGSRQSGGQPGNLGGSQGVSQSDTPSSAPAGDSASALPGSPDRAPASESAEPPTELATEPAEEAAKEAEGQAAAPDRPESGPATATTLEPEAHRAVPAAVRPSAPEAVLTDEPEADDDEAAIQEVYAELSRLEEKVSAQASGAQAASLWDPLPDWSAIFRVCADNETPPWLSSLLRKVSAEDENGTLVLTAEDAFVADRLRTAEAVERLGPVLEVWCGRIPEVRILASEKGRKSREELKAEVLGHPLVKEVESRFGAYVIDYGQLR